MRGPGLLLLAFLTAAAPAWAQESRDDVQALAKLRGRGATRVTLGATLLGLGLTFGAVSSALWIDGSSTANRYASLGDLPQLQGAVAMDVLSLSMIGAGTALLALGAGNLAEARRPRVALAPNGVTVHF